MLEGRGPSRIVGSSEAWDRRPQSTSTESSSAPLLRVETKSTHAWSSGQIPRCLTSRRPCSPEARTRHPGSKKACSASSDVGRKSWSRRVTIHAYLPAVIAGKDLEFISIIDATVDALDHSVHRSRVGLLAADAAVVSGLYQRALQDERLGASSPVNRIPEDVDACHRPSQGRRSECHVEAARRRHLERACRRRSRRRHCWCTEVSVVLEEMEPEIRVDSSTLALRTLERACESPHPSTMEPMPQTQGQDAPPSGHHRRRPAH